MLRKFRFPGRKAPCLQIQWKHSRHNGFFNILDNGRDRQIALAGNGAANHLAAQRLEPAAIVAVKHFCLRRQLLFGTDIEVFK